MIFFSTSVVLMIWIIFNELNYPNEFDYLIKNLSFQDKTRAFSVKENLYLGVYGKVDKAF